jgi:hypothetical protein
VRRRPAALDGTQTAEVSTAAVSGADALESTFARYLPQVVLAVVVPIAVLVVVAAIDPLAAGVMVLTLPLVPLFMWLVGRHTERRARERWRALALLANHFLDVVRGLPTLRAFNRGAAQVERIAEVSEEYRRTTMGTLRIAFLSGAILELAATLGIALVAVVVGVRLAEGGIGFEPALTVLVLAPELYLPLRNLATQWHASADGAAVAERLLDLSDATRLPDPLPHRVPRSHRSGSSACRFGIRHATSMSFAGSISSCVRERQSLSSAVRVEGRRRCSRCSCGSRSPHRGASSWVSTTSWTSTPRTGGAPSPFVPQRPDASSVGRSRTTSGSATRAGDDAVPPRPSSPPHTRSSTRSRTDTTRGSARADVRSRPASADVSRLARAFPPRRVHSSCSTSRPPTSTPKSAAAVRGAVERLRAGRTVLLVTPSTPSSLPGRIGSSGSRPGALVEAAVA